MCSAIDHPTRRREKQSITVDRYKKPSSPHGKYVMSPTYSVRPRVKSRLSRSGGCSVGWFGDGGAVFSAQPHSFDVVGARDPCDPFVIDPLARGLSCVDLGGDPGPPVGVVHRVDGADLLGEFDVRAGPGRLAGARR